MATSTFDRKITINDSESIKKIAKVMNDKVPKTIDTKGPFSKKNRNRGEKLLKQCQLRSQR